MARWKWLIAILLIALAVPLASGCEKKQSRLKIGLIDTDRLMREWSKYRSQSRKFIEERDALFKTLPKDPREFTLEQKKLIDESNSKWDKARRQLIEEVRVACEKVARAKGLDLVIADAQSNPVVEYGGIGITTDVLDLLESSD